MTNDTPYNPRREYEINGLMESDRDYVGNNMELAVRLLDTIGEDLPKKPTDDFDMAVFLVHWAGSRVIEGAE